MRIYLKPEISIKALEDYGFHKSKLFTQYSYINTLNYNSMIVYDPKFRLIEIKGNEDYDFVSLFVVLNKMHNDNVILIK